jgi:hypothetical protein
MCRSNINWSLYNQQLVNRGRPSRYVENALKNYGKDLEEMNREGC